MSNQEQTFKLHQANDEDAVADKCRVNSGKLLVTKRTGDETFKNYEDYDGPPVECSIM